VRGEFYRNALTNSGKQVAGGLIRGVRSSSEAGGKAGAEQAGFFFFQMRVYFHCTLKTVPMPFPHVTRVHGRLTGTPLSP
jgi:hypothetical protein